MQSEGGCCNARPDPVGACAASQRYDAFGNRTASSGQIPLYGYTGREQDGLGYTYYRARYYDPSVGRFTQRDPIELEGGINLYSYVEGNPVNARDPLGQDSYVMSRDLAIVEKFGQNITAERLGNPLTHSFTFTTNPDGSIAHTYSWGNDANLNGWSKDQAIDIQTAREALANGYASKVGPFFLDRYMDKAYAQLNKPENEHFNGMIIYNCKTESNKLIDLAWKLFSGK